MMMLRVSRQGSRLARMQLRGLALPAHTVVAMPSLSPTMTSGSIGKWLVKEGDKFEAGQALCEVETDKASVSFDATDEGYVAKILAGTEEMKCGDPIMVTVEDKADVPAFASFSIAGFIAPTTVATPPIPFEESPKPVSIPSPKTVDVIGDERRTFASPLARKMLREAGRELSLTELQGQGSGPLGRVVAEDVRALLARPASANAPPTTASTQATSKSPPVPAAQAAKSSSTQGASESFVDYHLSGAAYSRAMDAAVSKLTVPHYYLSVDLNLEALVKLRSALNGNMDADKGVSVLDLLVKAAAAAMKQVPEMNSSWMDGFVRKYNQVDVNVFMGSGEALHAPLVRDAAARGLTAISADLLSAAASPSEIVSGTFSIHNLGMFGVKSFAPIILAPQAGALALGAIHDTVVPREGVVKEGEDNWRVSPIMVVTLSCDHRVVDGAVGAAWLGVFKGLVENPMTLLL